MNPNANQNARYRCKHLINGKCDATRGRNYNDVKVDTQMQRKLAIIDKLSHMSIFEKIWFSLFSLGGILCLIFIRPFDIQLIFAVVSLYLYLISDNLTANGNKFGMIVIITSSVLYCINCFFYKIYGEIIVNVLLYIPIYVVSFINFCRNTNTENKNDEFLQVKKLGIRNLILAVTALVVGVIAVYFLLEVINSSFAFVNALTIVTFIIAMLLRLFRCIEFWWFETLGNVFNIVLWVLASLSDLSSVPFVLTTISSMFNSVYGYIVWRKLYRKSQVSKGLLLVKREIKIDRIIKVRRQYRNLVFSDQVGNNRLEKKGGSCE